MKKQTNEFISLGYFVAINSSLISRLSRSRQEDLTGLCCFSAYKHFLSGFFFEKFK